MRVCIKVTQWENLECDDGYLRSVLKLAKEGKLHGSQELYDVVPEFDVEEDAETTEEMSLEDNDGQATITIEIKTESGWVEIWNNERT